MKKTVLHNLLLAIGTIILSNNVLADSIWRPVGSTIDTESEIFVGKLAVDSSNNVYASSMNKIYELESLPNNNSWQVLGTIPSNNNVLAMVLDSNSNVYLGTTSEYVYEIPQGGNLQQLGDYVEGGWATSAIAVSLSGNVYTICGTTVYEKQPSTAKWQALPAVPNSYFGTTAMVLDSNNNVYVGTASGYVYKLSNDASHWEQLGRGIPEIMSMAVDSNNNIYVGTAINLGSGSVYKLLQGGNEWKQIGNKLDNGTINSIAIANNYIYILSSFGTMYYMSQEGSNWEPLSATPDNSGISAIAVDKDGNGYAGTAIGNVYEYIPQ